MSTVVDFETVESFTAGYDSMNFVEYNFVKALHL